MSIILLMEKTYIKYFSEFNMESCAIRASPDGSWEHFVNLNLWTKCIYIIVYYNPLGIVFSILYI